MADTGEIPLTMQGFGNPVSATGQGEKAGPQLSSSCDRSSTLMGNLVNVGSDVTRKNIVDTAAQNTEASSSYHKCNKNANAFCYICSKYEIPKNRRNITAKIKERYKECFGLEITNKESNWVPTIICNICNRMLQKCESSRSYLTIAVPAIWKKPQNQEDCYFCMTNLSRVNATRKSSILYANVSSLIRPMILPVSDRADDDHDQTMDTSLTSNLEKMDIDEDSNNEYESHAATDSDSEENDDYYKTYSSTEKNSKNVKQEDLNDLVRDLGLPKDGAEYLVSWLKGNKLIPNKIKSSSYRDREKEFRKFFTEDKDISLVYCHDIEGLMNELKPNCYKNDQWRLFIDASKRSLKAVLLHNTNVYAPVPIAHSVVTKEEYEKLKIVLEKIKYSEHNWQICGDLKILTILLGQQSGFTKRPCFLCEWDSRDRKNHYNRKVWPARTSLEPGHMNVVNNPLINPLKVLLPPLHIKLGLIKQLVKTLDKEGKCFQYLQDKFMNISDAKLKEGIFDGPQIRTLMRDETFVTMMNDTEKAAWLSFKNVVENFLGNHKSPMYKEIVSEMVDNFRRMGCLMNLKLHFLDSHVDYFPENLGDYSEEQGERFHQDIQEMERRYQGRWDVNMMADYCWMLKREVSPRGKKRKRMPLRRSFENKRIRYSKQK